MSYSGRELANACSRAPKIVNVGILVFQEFHVQHLLFECYDLMIFLLLCVVQLVLFYGHCREIRKCIRTGQLCMLWLPYIFFPQKSF